METHKKCSKCDELKSVNDFYLTQRGNRCKECLLKVTRNYKRKKNLIPNTEKQKVKNKKERKKLGCGKTHYYTILNIEKLSIL